MTTTSRNAGTSALGGQSFADIASSRQNNFDFLRFALAVAVILAHCYGPGEGISIPFSHRQWPIGSHAVEGFFAISGCLITASWERSSTYTSFAWKRFLRIFPGWAVSLIFCVLVVGPLAGADMSAYFSNPKTWAFFRPLLLFEPTGLPGVFENLPWKGSVNGPTWTIRFEVLCYCLVAAIGILGLLSKRWIVLGLFLAAIAAYTGLYFTAGDSFTWNLPWLGDASHLPRLIAFYLSGAAFYCFRGSIPRSRALAAAMTVACATLFHWQSVVLPICGTYALFYFATSRTIKLDRFGKHGDFSYGLYLYGFVVEQLIVHFFGYPPVPVFFLASTILTLAIAFLSWRFVEAPALRLVKRWPLGARVPSGNTPGSISDATLEKTPILVTSAKNEGQS